MTKIIVILGFLLSFAAGLVIGSRSEAVRELVNATVPQPRGPATQPTTRHSRGDFWTRELNLTAEQRKQLDVIWSSLASRGRSEHESLRRDYRRERDAAIAELVPPSRMDEYDRIIDAYSERVGALERESREAYAGAVDRTKQILSPQQRTTYEDLLKRHGWGARRSETRPTSQPAAAAAAAAVQSELSVSTTQQSHQPPKGAQ